MKLCLNHIRFYTFALLCLVSFDPYADYSGTNISKKLADTPQAMLGLWYGETTFNTGVSQLWITDRKENGDFRTEYRFFKDRQLLFSAAVSGKWGANEKYLDVSTVEACENGVAVPVRKEMELIRYTITKISSDELRYQHEASGTDFTVKKITEPPSKFYPDAQHLQEGQYYISSASGIRQLTLEDKETVRVIGIGQARIEGQIGVYVAYESEIDFDQTDKLEKQIYSVVTSLNDYIGTTGLDYCFVEAREPKPEGIIKQYRSHSSGYKKMKNNWQKL